MKSTSSFRRMVPPLMDLILLGTTMIMMSFTEVESKAILGVDLGSLYMKVALVRRNSPLEIVTNLHSKRKTEQMVLFDNGARFYGADASSLLARKPHLTPSAMTLMLGRHDEHPTVQVSFLFVLCIGSFFYGHTTYNIFSRGVVIILARNKVKLKFLPL